MDGPKTWYKLRYFALPHWPRFVKWEVQDAGKFIIKFYNTTLLWSKGRSVGNIYMQIGNMFFFHCCLQSLSSRSFTAAFCISPTGCFICYSCCLFLYQPHRCFYQSCYFLLYSLSVLLLSSLFSISPTTFFFILYQSCYFLLYSLSALLLSSLFSISPATFFSILYQPYYFLLYSLSVLLLSSLFSVSPATSFSILYQ